MEDILHIQEAVVQILNSWGIPLLLAGVGLGMCLWADSTLRHRRVRS